jgi:hypothetical protein
LFRRIFCLSELPGSSDIDHYRPSERLLNG